MQNASGSGYVININSAFRTSPDIGPRPTMRRTGSRKRTPQRPSPSSNRTVPWSGFLRTAVRLNQGWRPPHRNVSAIPAALPRCLRLFLCQDMALVRLRPSLALVKLDGPHPGQALHAAALENPADIQLAAIAGPVDHGVVRLFGFVCAAGKGPSALMQKAAVASQSEAPVVSLPEDELGRSPEGGRRGVPTFRTFNPPGSPGYRRFSREPSSALRSHLGATASYARGAL